MKRALAWLQDRLLAIAAPYDNGEGVGHLYHADGSLYMGRYQVASAFGFVLRLHHIATADLDRHMHDHPWHFLSLVLTGGYVELRPKAITPCFDGDTERADARHRLAGSLAFRRASDRHRIAYVRADTWTLFLTWPRIQWWGFYTPKGKVYWKDYPSVHPASATINTKLERLRQFEEAAAIRDRLGTDDTD